LTMIVDDQRRALLVTLRRYLATITAVKRVMAVVASD